MLAATESRLDQDEPLPMELVGLDNPRFGALEGNVGKTAELEEFRGLNCGP